MKSILVYLAAIYLLDKAFLRPSFIENKIKEVFLSYVGGAEEIEVDVDLAPFPKDLLGRIERTEIEMRGFQTETLPIVITPKKVMAGRIKRLKFYGEDIKYKSFSLKSVSLNLSDLEFNLPRLIFSRKMQFVGAGKGEVSLVLTEEAIKGAVKGKGDISFENDRLKIRVAVGYPPLAVPIEISGKLVGRGDKIYFTQPSGEVLSVPIPSELLQMAIDRFNPIIDISSLLPFTIPISIKDITIRGNELQVLCDIDLSELGKERKGER